MSHLLIITEHHLVATPAVDTEAAVTALRMLAAAGTYDTRPDGADRLMVVEAEGLAAIRATAARRSR